MTKLKSLSLFASVLLPFCAQASLHGQNTGSSISSAEFAKTWNLDATPIVLADGTVLSASTPSKLRKELVAFLKPYMFGPSEASRTARHFFTVDPKAVEKNVSYSQDPQKVALMADVNTLALKGFFLARDYERSAHDRDLYVLPHLEKYTFGVLPHSLDYDNYLVTSVSSSRAAQASPIFANSLNQMGADLAAQMEDLVLSRQTTRKSYLNDDYRISSIPSGNAAHWVFPDKYVLGIFKVLDRQSKLLTGPYYCEDKKRHEVKAEWGGLVERGLQGTVFKGSGLSFADLSQLNKFDDLFVGFYADDAMVKRYDNDLEGKQRDLQKLVWNRHNFDQDDLVGFVKIPAKLLRQPCARFIYVELDPNAAKQPKLDWAALFQVNKGGCLE